MVLVSIRMSLRHANLPVLILLAALGKGCGSPPLAPADGPIQESADTASPGGVDAATGDADPSATDGPFSISQCTPDADQTCNDDPTMSALAGTCQSVAAPSGLPQAPTVHYCECRDGYSNNSATGLCRAGDACVASGADPWPTTVILDHADCQTRTPTDCSPSGGNQLQILDNQLLQFAQRTCGLPSYHTLRVEFSAGCPTLMNIKVLGSQTAGPQLVACLTQALARQRWSCTSAFDCAMIEHDTLP